MTRILVTRASKLAERAIVKVVRAPFGDFRDWSEIPDWALEIADALTPAQAASA